MIIFFIEIAFDLGLFDEGLLGLQSSKSFFKERFVEILIQKVQIGFQLVAE